jgi:DNA polymerase-3 subunit gamma/tau
MTTRKLYAGISRVALLGATLLIGSAAISAPAPNVPYGAPLPTPGQGGGPGGGGPGGGGFRGGGGRGGFPTIGQIATVTGSSFTVTETNPFTQVTSTVTVKTTPTTEFITSTDATTNDIAVGDTLQVRGRPGDDPTTLAARQIVDGTVGLPATPPTPPAGAAAPPPAPGGGGGGFGGGRVRPTVGVVTALSPLTIKSADGTVYTVDTSNDPTVSKTSAATIDSIVAGKYVTVMATPPATPPTPGAPGTPIAPPTNVTAVRITVSDTMPTFGGRGGGGGGFGGGGGGGFGGGAPPPPAQ